jgi:MATE family multidrug resistance protein
MGARRPAARGEPVSNPVVQISHGKVELDAAVKPAQRVGMSSVTSAPITNAAVLRIAVPIVLSNVSEPLIGVVNTAVMGRLPGAHYIGGVAVGALIFSFLFWGFGFLRLSTGGLAAQATGAGDRPALVTLLVRSLMLALAIGLCLVAAGPWLGPFAVGLVGGSEAVMAEAQTYFSYRIWAAPAALTNFAIMGWFIGQGKASTAFVVQLVLNLTNMTLSALLVLYFGFATAGVGLAVVTAEYSAMALGLALALRQMLRMGLRPHWPDILQRDKFAALIAANGDIMIRTLCLVFAFGWFVSRGAKQGDVIIAANAVVLNLFEVSAYMMDGFAYAAEALVGQAIGAKILPRFRQAVWLTSVWAGVLATICAIIILLFGSPLVAGMTLDPKVRDVASHYLPWAALATVLGTVCFQMDGIFTGAMATRDMRNMMVVSLAVYMIAWWYLEPAFGNHGLWAALNVFFIIRGLTFTGRLGVIERRAFG